MNNSERRSENPISKFIRKYREKRLFKRSSTKEVFTWIYRTNKWRGTVSSSGTGSSLEQTQNIRAELPTILKRLNSKILLDIPCGDFNWMQHIALEIEEYIGADIVDDIIKKNMAQFERPGRRFVQLDLICDPLPHCDVIFCRDCFVHLNYESIDQAIKNIKSSDCQYLIATTFMYHKKNRDGLKGKHRILNLQEPPFNWPEPVYSIKEDCPSRKYRDKGKSLGVWSVTDILPLDL